MDEKYHEIVQFFRDTENPDKMQKAANEYQIKFAKNYYNIKQCLEFDIKTVT
jgi:hypothetical protein